MKILLGTPIKNRAWCLKEHLENLRVAMNCAPEHEYYSMFLENDSTDETWQIITDWEKKQEEERGLKSFSRSMKLDLENTASHQEHFWEGAKLERMALMRSEIIKKAIDLDACIFTVDSDIFFKPTGLGFLSKLDFEIVSPVLWSDWRDQFPLNRQYPQVWEKGSCSMSQALLERMRKLDPCFVQLYGFGAITWINIPKILERIERGFFIKREHAHLFLNYYSVPNFDEYMRGEDRSFATRVSLLGCEPVACNKHFEAWHVDGKKEWEGHYKRHLETLLYSG